MLKKPFISEETLVEILQGLGYNLTQDDSTAINYGVVYELALNEGYRYFSTLDLWLAPNYQ
ncbi:hypothetical protein [Sutcliffiella cohnii]|uniref:hypothetical protein n=1 Tax=Sutcliffiella cohnii TaxID=33932 RepID=UPI000835558B|nr:hypothetical protein [Sutcliffiella cohnii]